MNKFTLLLSFLLLSAYLYGQVDITLQDLSPMPVGKAAISSATNGTDIYICNGYNSTDLNTTSVEKYNIATDTWSTFTDATLPKRYGCSEIYGDNLYIFDGINSTSINNKVEIVNLTTGTISYGADNPLPTRSSGSCLLGNKIYVFGGSFFDGTYSNKLYEYNIDTNSWTSLADMPEAKETRGKIVNNTLYVIGGYNGNASYRIDKYDFSTNTWSFEAYLPAKISAHATTVIDDKIWVVGDYTNLTFLGYYNTSTKNFITLNNNMVGRRHSVAENINGKLYIVGGTQDSSATGIINSVQVYDSTTITDVPQAERDALSAIYNATNGDNWTNNANWKTTVPVIDWHGITVSTINGQNHVTEIDLSQNNLDGNLPADIGLLTELIYIDLHYNQKLTGNIPPEIGNLIKLKYLSLWDDDFTGTIPSEIGNCTELTTLSFEDNRLTGNIPSSFANLTAMRSFWVNGNNLSGEIPDIFSGWNDLVFFSIGNANHTQNVYNNFTGTLDLSNNSNLRICWIDNTDVYTLYMNNGNNTNVSDYYFNAQNTPNLTCVFVDDPTYSKTNWTRIDATATFIQTQAECDALYTYIPDDNFEQALIDLGYDNVLDDYVPTSHISGITELNVDGAGKLIENKISDMTGIEDFVSLTKLTCWNNPLSSIDLTNNTNLVFLAVGYGLTSLDVSQNTNLETLYCPVNNLSTLDLSNNTKLRTLSCDSNLLDNLDLSNNPSIQYLNVGNNNLTSLNVDNLSQLVFLSCSNNQISNLNISNNMSLNSFYFDNNLITEMDLSQHNLIDRLICSGNNLTYLNVQNGNNTNFTIFEASNNPELICIFVDDANYSNSNWTNKDLTASFIQTQSECDALYTYTYIPDDNFEQALIDLGYDHVLDDYVLTPVIKGITSLSLNNKGINDLTGIEDFTALTFLDCRTNNLNSLDITNNIHLTSLICAYNNLTEIDLSNNLKLQSLLCGPNNLAILDVSNNLALTTLWCDRNELTSLDISKNTELTSFICNDNQLENIDVSNNLKLYYLQCGNNPTTSLDLSNNSELVTLHCSNSHLSSLDISKNTNLKSLTCSENLLTELNLQTNTLLTQLSCDNNQLTSLDLTNNTLVNNINIYGNLFHACALNDLFNSLPQKTSDNKGQLSIKNGDISNVGAETCNTDLAIAKNWEVYDINNDWNNKITFSGDGTGCTGDYYLTPENNYLEVTNLEVTNHQVAEENTATFNLLTNTDWTATTDVDWLTLSFTNLTNKSSNTTIISGSGNAAITATAEVNLTEVDRTAEILIEGVNVNSKTIIIKQSATVLGIDDIKTDVIVLYPNPVTNVLNIECSTKVENYDIYNYNGKRVLSGELKNNNIEVNHLSSGIYLIRLISNEGVFETKFIKQ